MPEWRLELQPEAAGGIAKRASCRNQARSRSLCPHSWSRTFAAFGDHFDLTIFATLHAVELGAIVQGAPCCLIHSIHLTTRALHPAMDVSEPLATPADEHFSTCALDGCTCALDSTPARSTAAPVRSTRHLRGLHSTLLCRPAMSRQAMVLSRRSRGPDRSPEVMDDFDPAGCRSESIKDSGQGGRRFDGRQHMSRHDSMVETKQECTEMRTHGVDVTGTVQSAILWQYYIDLRTTEAHIILLLYTDILIHLYTYILMYLYTYMLVYLYNYIPIYLYADMPIYRGHPTMCPAPFA